MSISEQDRSAMEKYALQNAVKHEGKAEVGAVVSKVLGETPALRSMAKEVARAAAEVVKAVNALSPQAQEQELKATYPEAMQAPEKKEGRVGLPPLEGAVTGNFVVRLPPEPSGFMHIGHAMAGTINDVYKENYNGKLWLRFEDTNPRKVQKRYYESFRTGYSWLGIKWDYEKNVSSDVELIYEHIQDLIESGSAYACACAPETMKKLRFDGKACEHREQTTERSLAIWDEMLGKKHKEGSYVIRLKGDLSSLDYSLRDPNIARIIDYTHPLTGDKYCVWPTYDFEVVVEDQVCGVTHILRSSEFHVGLQDLVRQLLGFPAISVTQFSRFNFKGTPVQKRLLRPLVEEKLVTGWDDPRMPTIEGVIRRGIIPEAIRRFTVEVGYTKSEHTFDWSLLLSVNRKLLDPVTKRVYFVPDPLKLTVEGAPGKQVTIPFHPLEKLGGRTIDTAGLFFVPSGDIARMEAGQVFRLMELYNVRLVSKTQGGEVIARFEGEEMIQDSRKLQWVAQGDSHGVEVLEPSELFSEDGTFNKDSLKTRLGVVEGAFENLKQGEIVQFPRYGFVRLDAPSRCVLTHG
ncbi:MAG: glutamate--tRNA ligase [Thaumarchaeota archaeon]|nr:glutamate--tRNA ligase [Nitrososphaerota archaeon]